MSDYTGPKTLAAAGTDEFMTKAFGKPAKVVSTKELVGGVLSVCSMCTVEVGGEKKQVVVKIPTDNDGSRAFAVAGNAYNKEVQVYAQLKPDLDSIGFTIANCIYSDTDSKDGGDTCEWFVLVIDAFPPEEWVPQDQVIGMDTDAFKLAVADLARFHTKFWGSPVIDREWVTSTAAKEKNGGHSILAFFQPFHAGFPGAYTAFLDIWGNAKSNPNTTKCCYFHDGPYVTGPENEKAGGTAFDLKAIKECILFLAKEDVCVPMHEAMYDIIKSRPRTLTFGDYRGDNMFRSVDKTKMAYIDFQLFNAGPPGYDFNQPVGSFDFSVFSHYEEFIDIWYATVAKQTGGAEIVAQYPREHFIEDWKIGCVQFVTGIIPLGVGTFSIPQGDRMTNLWMYAINRYMMGMAKLGVPEYIKALAEKKGIAYP